MSRRAIRNMNAFYPNATAQDIENSDNVCIICRENMLGNGSCKKLPCNHIFHISCLRSWFQRQQTCPTCRMDVLRVNQEQQQAAAAAGDIGVAAGIFQNNNNNNNPNQPPGNSQTPLTNNNNQQQQRQQTQPPPPQQQANGQIPFPPLPPFTHPLLFQQFQQFFGQQQRREQQQSNNGNQQQQTTTGTTQQQSANNSTTGVGGPSTTTMFDNMNNESTNIAGSSSIPATVFPFLQSPPFSMPQIPIETLLQGFSDDELRYLEGQTRQQLEARIKCLMDVKTLITAAMIRLQQYNCVILNCPIQNSIGTQTTSTDAVAEQQKERPNLESSSKTSTEIKSPINNISSPSAQQSSSSSSRPTVISHHHNVGGDNLDDNDDNNNHNNNGNNNDQEELIRQRRLQRFTKNIYTLNFDDNNDNDDNHRGHRND